MFTNAAAYQTLNDAAPSGNVSPTNNAVPLSNANYVSQPLNPFGSTPTYNAAPSNLGGASTAYNQPTGVSAPFPTSNTALPPPIFQTDIPAGKIGAPSSLPGPDMNTLDEPVSVTLKRDLSKVAQKLKMVMMPRRDKDILRDWDLWGPLLLCLVLAVCLGITAPNDQSAYVFTLVFVIVWCGSAVVTVNSQLLGGHLSFFQSVCVLGYCIAPLALSSVACLFVPALWIRAIFVSVAFFWATSASVGFLSDSNLNKRRALAVYPIFLFYFVTAWLILISKSMI